MQLKYIQYWWQFKGLKGVIALYSYMNIKPLITMQCSVAERVEWYKGTHNGQRNKYLHWDGNITSPTCYQIKPIFIFLVYSLC